MSARGYPVFPEPGRQIVREEMLIGGSAMPLENPATFACRCINRSMYFFNIADPRDRPALFDRSIVDAVTALESIGAAEACCGEAIRRYRYAPRVFMVPPWPELFHTDAERQHKFEAAEAEFHALMESFPAKGYEVLIVPRATIPERVDFLESRLAGK